MRRGNLVVAFSRSVLSPPRISLRTLSDPAACRWTCQQWSQACRDTGLGESNQDGALVVRQSASSIDQSRAGAQLRYRRYKGKRFFERFRLVTLLWTSLVSFRARCTFRLVLELPVGDCCRTPCTPDKVTHKRDWRLSKTRKKSSRVASAYL